MNVYVETNFVFELVFQQEQSESCENVLSVCESQNIPLLLPAYCLAEPHEKLRRQYSLSPQDAIVFASVVGHLGQNSSAGSCFLNKNSRDFDNPDIVDALKQYNCKMIPKFDDSYRYILNSVGTGQS